MRRSELTLYKLKNTHTKKNNTRFNTHRVAVEIIFYVKFPLTGCHTTSYVQRTQQIQLSKLETKDNFYGRLNTSQQKPQNTLFLYIFPLMSRDPSTYTSHGSTSARFATNFFDLEWLNICQYSKQFKISI